MKKFLALIVARNKEFYRDRATLVWTFIFPFIVLAGFTYGYSGSQDPILKLAVNGADQAPAATLEALRGIPGLSVITPADSKDAFRKLERYEYDLLLSAESPDALTYYFHDDSDQGRLAERLLTDAISKEPGAKSRLERGEITGRRVRYADWLLPGLIAMNIMFGSMFGVGYVLVRYRKNGVLKRLRATPLSAFQFLAAQIVSRMLLMVFTSLIVLTGARLLIGFQPQGSWLELTIFLAVSSASMISLGLIVAARMNSEEVADGVLNVMTWPMIFLSGIWFSLDGASSWVQTAAQALPLTHVVNGLRAILIDGEGIAQVYPQMILLLILSGVFLGIGSLIFRWR